MKKDTLKHHSLPAFMDFNSVTIVYIFKYIFRSVFASLSKKKKLSVRPGRDKKLEEILASLTLVRQPI